MIQGFQYFSGPQGDVMAIAPVSAFSKGDLLSVTASGVSRINELMPSGEDILGVAECDSTQSISGKCLVRIPDADTLFLASTHSATGSGLTTGQELDIAFAVPNGRYYVTTSTTSVRVAVVRGTIGPMAMDQSVHSQVVVKLIRNAGNLELS